MSLTNNTTKLNEILDTVNSLPNAVTIDSTLTQPGQAADAKTVGDALAEKQPSGDYALKSEIPGVATAEEFGHVKTSFTEYLLQPGIESDGEDPSMWYDINRNLIGNWSAAEEYLKGIVPGMFYISVLEAMMAETTNQLDARVETLEKTLTAGTEDLTAGTSPLATGTLYFVYE